MPAALPSPRRLVPAALALLAATLLAAPARAQGNFSAIGEQSTPQFANGEPSEDWYWWWYLNKDPYLQLRQRIMELAPISGTRRFFLGNGEREVPRDPNALSAYELHVLMVPSILEALSGAKESSRVPDMFPSDGFVLPPLTPMEALDEDADDTIVQASLMALAKIGRKGERAEQDTFHEIISDYLDADSGAVRDRAVVALGVNGDLDSIPTLVELLGDTPRGQRLVDKTEVPRSMRAYAAYALGLVGRRSEDPDVRRGIVAELATIVVGPKFATRDIKTACLASIGIVPLELVPWEPPAKRVNGRRPPPADPTVNRLGQIRFLAEYFDDVRTSHYYLRSVALTAMTRLAEGADAATREEVLEVALRALRRHTTEKDPVVQSATLALGLLADSDDDKLDRKAFDTLLRTIEYADRFSRRFAMISLGKMAARRGNEFDPWANRDKIVTWLRRQMSGRAESRVRAWCALALGVAFHELRKARQELPEDALEAMRKELEDCLTPLDIGAYSLALALAGDEESADVMVGKLEKFEVDTARGLVLLSIGLIGKREHEELLLEELRDTNFRGERMAFTSIGLALAGAPDRVRVLQEMLERSGGQSAQGPIVAALAVCGDRRVIPTLAEIVRDPESYTDDVRAAAIVGLGNIGDKDQLLWRTPFAQDVNYLGAPGTLLGQGQGVLMFY